MKQLLTLSLFVASALSASAQSRFDLNGDNEVNVGDVTMLINVILGKETDDTDPGKETGDTDPAVKEGLCPDAHHPHVIDMGAAGKWACCNVGASSPTDYGGYYAWGETEEKSYYDWDTYKYCHESGDNFWYNDLGDISGKAQYDVAAAKWGGAWKMPTLDRIQLLLNCANEWTTINGVNGLLFTASNGNHLFLPAAGGRDASGLSYASKVGYYWSSSPHASYSGRAYALVVCKSGADWSNSVCYHGLSVRPVAE